MRPSRTYLSPLLFVWMLRITLPPESDLSYGSHPSARMGFLWPSLAILCAVISTISANPTTGATTVTLDNGAFIGSTSHGIAQFLGIPFAQPPCVSALSPIPYLSSLIRPIYYQHTVLVTYVSVFPKSLALIMAPIMLPHLVLLVHNRRSRGLIQLIYPRRRQIIFKPSFPHWQETSRAVKIVRRSFTGLK